MKSYKESLEEVNRILEKIESGKPDVDELTDLVNKALKLIKDCQLKLRTTEENIQKNFNEEN